MQRAFKLEKLLKWLGGCCGATSGIGCCDNIDPCVFKRVLAARPKASKSPSLKPCFGDPTHWVSTLERRCRDQAESLRDEVKKRERALQEEARSEK